MATLDDPKTPGNMIGMLAAEAREARRKRARVEVEEEVEADETGPKLPPEVKQAIMEQAELGHRGVVPTQSTRLVEISQIWAEVYAAWLNNRKLKMEHPPDLITLDIARLFISPRFKLITEMQGSVAMEILKAYADAMVAEEPKSPRFQVLVFYRANLGGMIFSWEWRIALLTGIRKNEKEFIRFESFSPKFGGGFGEEEAISFLDTHTVWIGPDAKGMIVDWDWNEEDDDPDSDDEPDSDDDPVPDDKLHIADALIYGQVNYYPLYDSIREEVLERLRTVAYMFWIDAIRFDRPSPGMLAMRDKIIVVRAAARPAYIRGGQGSYHSLDDQRRTMRVDESFYREQEASFADEVVTVYIDLPLEIKIGELDDKARHESNVILAAKGSIFPGAMHHVRVEAVWPSGARVKLTEWSRETGKIFAIPEDEFVLEAIQARVAEMPEPALEPFEKHRDDWGYELSTWVPEISEGTLDEPDVKGFLIMPATWFFYLATDREDHPDTFIGLHGKIEFTEHFALAKAGFWFHPHTAMFLTNNSRHIHAHQTSELIFLPDEINNALVEDLTLLQRRDIETRATASLVEEVREEVELL